MLSTVPTDNPGNRVSQVVMITAHDDILVDFEDSSGGYTPGELAPAPDTPDAKTWLDIPYRRLKEGRKHPVTATPDELQAIAFTAHSADQVHSTAPPLPSS